jgi:dipeptidyl aminopeptidase/acylaminoacyl peptidase
MGSHSTENVTAMKFLNLVPRLGMLAVVCSSLLPQSVAQTPPTPRAITIEDEFQVRDVTDPQITADGKWVAYVVSTQSLKEDKADSRIWMIPTTGGDPTPLTAEDVSSDHPRWSPDGKFLAFTSKRGEGKATQVYLLNRMGGEAQRLTDTVQDVDDFAWSPDSKRLVLVLRDPSPDELEEASSKTKPDSASSDSKEKSKTPHPIVIDRYEFKADDIGYLDRRRAHLFVFDIATKTTTQITSGDYDDEEPAWSPDSKLLAFSSNRSQPDPDRNYDSNIWVVAADNTDKGAHLTQITTNPGTDEHPAWSPDGKWIAYITQLGPKPLEYATHHLAVSASTGGFAKVLTTALDRMVTEPHFAPDSQSIYFIDDDDGAMNLCRVPVAGGEVTRPIPGRLIVSSYTVANSGEIAAALSTTDRPYEIFTITAGAPQRVSHVNDSWLAQVKLSLPDYVKFKSKDGTTVAGFLYKPIDYIPGKKYPAILRPHGGPTWSYYAEFTHLAQLYAANGYVVLYPNPRGSTGYGENFCKAILADWGNKDFQDDMAMVDYAIAQGLVDPDKLGVGGWSYGAISTDFIIAQTTRFKAAISGAGSAEFTSFYGHDQYIKDYENELGRPWEKRVAWDRVAPFWKVANITTPTLFMGGEIDWNVPILGGEQMYQALKSLNKETELVVYPGEYHGFKTPTHVKDRLERYLAWYAHYVKQDGSPARPPEPPKQPPPPAKSAAGSE